MGDIAATSWSETDANNNQPPPDGFPTGMPPSGENRGGRAMMGALKRWYNQTIPLVTGGSLTAYTLSYAIGPAALVDGQTHLVQFNVANGAAATLNVNALGAKPLYAYSRGTWYAAPPGLFDVDTVCQVTYHASSGTYRLVMPGADATGMVVPDAGATAPAGYLQCFGQAISRANYPGLYAVIGTTYGAGDASTTFNLPDLRGRVAAGKDGGTPANRLTSATMTPDGATLGATGGAQTETAAVSGNASVVGPTSGPNNFAGSNTGGNDFATAIHGHDVAINAPVTGSTASVTNVQPTLILNYVIKL